jgi:hypothetical protein
MSRLGIYMRWKPGQERLSPAFPPLPNDHALVDVPCLACGFPLNAGGQSLALLAVGPGDIPENQLKHAQNRWYPAEALPFHASCVGVVKEDDDVPSDV